MEIVKEGRVTTEVKLTERFECKNCGCEFKAEEDEYYIENNNPLTHDNYTITLNATPNEYLICSCPACHKIIRTKKNIFHNIKVQGISPEHYKNDAITVAEYAEETRNT